MTDIPILRDEEDEPDFRPLLDKAKARIVELGHRGDGPLIWELLGMIQHLYGEIDAMENHISDYGPAVEDDDDPAHWKAELAAVVAKRPGEPAHSEAPF